MGIEFGYHFFRDMKKNYLIKFDKRSGIPNIVKFFKFSKILHMVHLFADNFHIFLPRLFKKIFIYVEKKLFSNFGKQLIYNSKVTQEKKLCLGIKHYLNQQWSEESVTSHWILVEFGILRYKWLLSFHMLHFCWPNFFIPRF